MQLSASNNLPSHLSCQTYAHKLSGALSLDPAGLLFPGPKDVVNVLCTDIGLVHQPIEDANLGCTTLVVELGYSVIITIRANIEQPAMGLAGLT